MSDRHADESEPPQKESERDDFGDPDGGSLDPAWQAEHARLLAENKRLRDVLSGITRYPTSTGRELVMQQIAADALASPSLSDGPPAFSHCLTCDGVGEVRVEDSLRVCPVCEGWGGPAPVAS